MTQENKTAVKPHNCLNSFQDERYGRGNRLMNWAWKAFNKMGGWRCTVCGGLIP